MIQLNGNETFLYKCVLPELCLTLLGTSFEWECCYFDFYDSMISWLTFFSLSQLLGWVTWPTIASLLDTQTFSNSWNTIMHVLYFTFHIPLSGAIYEGTSKIVQIGLKLWIHFNAKQKCLHKVFFFIHYELFADFLSNEILKIFVF